MRLSLAAVVLFAVFVMGSPAEEPKKPITKEIARKAIAIFRADPESELGRGAASVILHFAEESADVEVAVSPAVMPWLGAQTEPRHSSALMTAYMAGTIRSQLDSGVTKNDPVAGAEQVIETYQQLRRSDPTFRVPAVEKFIELKAQGKLKENFTSK